MGHFRNILHVLSTVYIQNCTTPAKMMCPSNPGEGVDCGQIFYLETFNYTTHLRCKMIDM